MYMYTDKLKCKDLEIPDVILSLITAVPKSEEPHRIQGALRPTDMRWPSLATYHSWVGFNTTYQYI